MKTEIISLTKSTGKLEHYSSTETKEMKIDKKNFFQEALQYIEQHATNSGFKILNVALETAVVSYFLIKD